MKTDYTIEHLATLRFNKLWCALKSNNERWFEVIEYRGLNQEFESWLKENCLTKNVQHAEDFLAYKDKRDYATKDWENFVKNKIEYENDLHYVMFYTLLEHRLKEYKDKPYEGKLVIGHFLGIKKNVNDNPYEYKNHVIGQIEDYKVEPDGRISTYVLSKPDNTEVILPTEMTYKVY